MRQFTHHTIFREWRPFHQETEHVPSAYPFVPLKTFKGGSLEAIPENRRWSDRFRDNNTEPAVGQVRCEYLQRKPATPHNPLRPGRNRLLYREALLLAKHG